VKASDINIANVIITGLNEIGKKRTAMATGIRYAGVRCEDAAQTNIPVADQDKPVILATIRRRLDLEEANLRRRAAQIGLVL
jgi:hypothetical protein